MQIIKNDEESLHLCDACKRKMKKKQTKKSLNLKKTEPKKETDFQKREREFVKAQLKKKDVVEVGLEPIMI